MMYNVLIVDDQISSQDFMKYAILRGNDKFHLQATLTDADGVSTYMRKSKSHVDLILMDIHTNNKVNGIKVARELKKVFPQLKVIILTFLVEEKHIQEAKEAGCDAFFYKDYAQEDLLDVMNKVMLGENVFPSNIPVITIGRAKSSDFTKQELRVLKAKVSGYSNAEICSQLRIKPPTLDTHIRNLKYKTGYENMLLLVSDVASKRFIIAERNLDN